MRSATPSPALYASSSGSGVGEAVAGGAGFDDGGVVGE
jgi:hypothetical protein